MESMNNTEIEENSSLPVGDAVLSDEEAMMMIEAILFAAGYPVMYKKISDSLGIGVSKVRELIAKKAEEFSPESSHGFILLSFPDSAQFCTKECYAGQIKDALGIKRGGNLSNSSMEVLATIAYNEPVTRAYVDTVRGVDSAYSINSLLEKGLIEPCGRLDSPGRPILYRTTEAFLRCFGLGSLKELPDVASVADSSDKD